MKIFFCTPAINPAYVHAHAFIYICRGEMQDHLNPEQKRRARKNEVHARCTFQTGERTNKKKKNEMRKEKIRL